MLDSLVLRMSAKNVFWICVLLYVNAGLPYQDGALAAHDYRNKREITVPDIFANISWNRTELFSSGDELTCTFCIQHNKSSTTDAFNAHFKWIFPQYVTFQSLNQTFGSKTGLGTSLHASVIEMKIHHLSLNEIVCFTLSFLFDPEVSLQPGRHFIVSHTQLYWTDHAMSRETTYSSRWQAFSIEVEVPGMSSHTLSAFNTTSLQRQMHLMLISNGYSHSCSKELGLSNGQIKNYTITSSSHIAGYESFKARLGSSTGWCASQLDLNQFLQVDFIHQVTVTKISVRSQDISQYSLQYSTDNQNWKNYSEYGSVKIFQCVPDMVSTHWVMYPFDAYNIRLWPRLWNNSMCLTMELYGCQDKKSQASCNIPLGMESGFITDAALSASQPKANFQDSRLNKKKFTGSASAGWLASPYDPDDYLQIDLAVLYQVTKIGVQGEWSETVPSKNFVKHYTVKMSNDSVTWWDHTAQDGTVTVFNGPATSAMGVYPTFATLTPPVVARFLRIYPQKQENYRIMRLELYGCLKEPMPSYQVPQEFSRRSYLLNNESGDVHVCLYRQDRTDSSCMISSGGYSWRNVNSWIVNILAIDTVKRTIYALDRSNTYLRSSDNGHSWMAISHSQWMKAKTLSRMIFAKKVPENLLASDHVNGDVSVSRDGTQWTVSNTGIHVKRPGQDWTVAATWKCCST